MVVLENSVDIAAPPRKVFDYLGDMRNEAEWNQNVRSVRLLSGDSVGVGSVYRVRWAGGPETLVEYTRFEPPGDRPGEWACVGRSNAMTINFTGRVTSAPSGSRLTVRMELNPRGPAWLLQPVLRRRMQGRELDNMRAIKHAMESLPAR